MEPGPARPRTRKAQCGMFAQGPILPVSPHSSDSCSKPEAILYTETRNGGGIITSPPPTSGRPVTGQTVSGEGGRAHKSQCSAHCATLPGWQILPVAAGDLSATPVQGSPECGTQYDDINHIALRPAQYGNMNKGPAQGSFMKEHQPQ